ncbi:MAG: hypothetical protein WC906_04140 [Parcubacteria group bacterium]|jgi:hypothetical protein
MTPELEAQASALTLQVFTGVSPDVDGSQVSYGGQNVSQARSGLNEVLFAMRANRAVPGHSVDYELANVVWPVLLRQTWWIIAGAGLLGYYIATRKEPSKNKRTL